MRYALALLGLLAGCAAPQQSPADYQAGLATQCHAMGFQWGTEAMSNCILQLHTVNLQRQRPKPSFGDALMEFGNALQSAPPRRMPIETQCSTLGAFTRCSTY